MPALITPAPAILFAPLAVIVLCAVCLAAGRRVARLLGTPTSMTSQGERCVIYVTLGAGALQFLPFALGVAGILSTAALRVAIGVLAVFLIPDLRAVAGAALRERPARPTASWKTALILTLAPALVCSLLLALTPTLDPDGLAYHLTVPKRWLASGRLEYLPTYIVSNLPLGVEMLFTSALALAGDAAAKLLHWVLALSGVCAVYYTGVRAQSKTVGVVCALIYLVSPVGVGAVLGLAYIEGALGLAVATTALAWLHWRRTRHIGWLRTAAFLLGVTVSFKMTALVFGAALAALTAASFLAESRPVGTFAIKTRDALGVLALAAAPVAPWFARSAIVTGNPFFPLFARVIPSRDFWPATAAMFDTYNRYFLWAGPHGASWSLAFRQLILVAAALLVFAIVTTVVIRGKTRFGRAAAIILGFGVALQLSAVGLYVRYWIPFLPVVLMPVAAWLERALLERGVSPVRFRWLLVAVGAMGALYQVRSSLERVDYDTRGVIETVVGRETSPDFLRRHIVVYPLYELMNRELPADAHVALSYSSCRGFYIDRMTFCTEYPQDAIGFSSWEQFSSGVERLHVTHVIAPIGVADGRALPGPDYSAPAFMFRDRENVYMERLLTSEGRLIAQAGDQGLYALDRGSTK